MLLKTLPWTWLWKYQHIILLSLYSRDYTDPGSCSYCDGFMKDCVKETPSNLRSICWLKYATKNTENDFSNRVSISLTLSKEICVTVDLTERHTQLGANHKKVMQIPRAVTLPSKRGKGAQRIGVTSTQGCRFQMWKRRATRSEMGTQMYAISHEANLRKTDSFTGKFT